LGNEVFLRALPTEYYKNLRYDVKLLTFRVFFILTKNSVNF